MAEMNHEGILASERIEEVMMMCPRNNPLYEQISNFSIALYVIGHYDCDNLLHVDDVENTTAASILKKHFLQINELPEEYNIVNSEDRYLLVIGDPNFPEHFAAVINTANNKPFFSKLRLYGSGFDSLDELKGDFLNNNGFGSDYIHYYRKV
jgi:hypothetical protein